MDNSKIIKLKKQFEDFLIESNSDILKFYTTLILKKQDCYNEFSNHADKNQKLYFADGAIGSGKSTIMKNYIIRHKIENLLYYNPEYYVNCFGLDTDFISEYNKVKKYLWKDIQERILTEESVIVESVFTKEEKINFLKFAKEQGYKLNGIYVGTNNPNINIERVNKRIQEGSHTVPEEKIIDRYYKSLEKLQTIFEISDTFILYDNSYKPSLILYKEINHICIANTFPSWANDFLLKKINLNDYDYTRY